MKSNVKWWENHDTWPPKLCIFGHMQAPKCILYCHGLTLNKIIKNMAISSATSMDGMSKIPLNLGQRNYIKIQGISALVQVHK